MFGIIIGQMGHEAQVMIDFFDVLSHVVMRIVNFIMWSVLDAHLQLCAASGQFSCSHSCCALF